ncbi:type VI protein secretion system component VasF [Massilia sp. MP_M2]|uniref:hypothetical protein n=1 Tax=Massilia sp. MP_M2 TaxID=3071713 RepID=UPI00319E0948
MFDFFAGYLLGSSAQTGPRVSGKAVAIAALCFMVCAGMGWLWIGEMFDREPVSCSGAAMAAMMCELEASGKKIGMFLLGACAIIVVAWFGVASLLKK